MYQKSQEEKGRDRKKNFYLFTLLIILVCNGIFAKGDDSFLIKRPSYIYISEGKPDPFKPFVAKEEGYKSLPPEELKKLKMVPILKTELQRIKLSELKIVAMIKTKNGILAMVEGPTGKGYLVKKGMGIGTRGGIVDKVIYKEEMTPLGKKVIRKIIIKEPFIDKNGKVKFKYLEISMGEKKAE